MRREPVFKKRYVLLPAIFFLAIFGWIFHSLSFPVEQEVHKTIKINKLVTLYITQANAGAMTSFSWHYYLYEAKKNEKDFINHLNEMTPFMITNDDNVNVSVNDGQLYLNVRGDIYLFRNTTSLARVHLTASPY